MAQAVCVRRKINISTNANMAKHWWQNGRETASSITTLDQPENGRESKLNGLLHSILITTHNGSNCRA